MPRRPKRKRDPARSRKRGAVVLPATRRPLVHSDRATKGPGWACALLPSVATESLLELLAATPLTGRAFRSHNAEGEQAGDKPLMDELIPGVVICGVATLWMASCYPKATKTK